MENKEIINFLEGELKAFTILYGEIKNTEDYILFLNTLSKLAISMKNKELGSPLGVSMSNIIKQKEEMNKILKNLTLTNRTVNEFWIK